MSRKYVAQQKDYNFLYPNNDPEQYDVEIVHDINNASVSGSVTNFVMDNITSTSFRISYTATWVKNGAEPYIKADGNISLWSLHFMSPTYGNYVEPWQVIQSSYDTVTTGTTYVESVSTTYSVPSGVQTGDYYFQFRFIGHRSVFKVNIVESVVGATPTPTPTVTPTATVGSTPTPTPTPSVTPSSGGGGGTKSLQIYGRDVDGSPSTLTLFYNVNGTGNINVPGYTSNALPGTCTFLYTITGLTEFDSVVFGTSIACVMNGNGSSSSCPSSSGSATTFTYVIDAPTTQQVALTIDSGFIP
jgi:hypothetical protein